MTLKSLLHKRGDGKVFFMEVKCPKGLFLIAHFIDGTLVAVRFEMAELGSTKLEFILALALADFLF